MDESDLQIDHHVLYEVGGENEGVEQKPDDFMLLSGSANRAKSWSCQHCENWQTLKKKEICLTCYWAYPEEYSHVAMQMVRRLDLIWQGDEVEKYEKIKNNAIMTGQAIPEYVKNIIEKAIDRKKHER